MIESLINKALNGNLDLVKKVLEDLDTEFFDVSDREKIKQIREKFNVKPSYIKKLYVCGSPIKVWSKRDQPIDPCDIPSIQKAIADQIHNDMSSGQIFAETIEFWWKSCEP